MPHLLFYFFLYSSIPQTTVIKKAPFLLFFVFHMDLQQHSPGDWSLSFFFPGIRFSSFWQLVVKQPLKAEHGKVLVLAGSSQGTDCITALWRASNAEDIFRAVMWRAPDLSCHVLCLWGKLPPKPVPAIHFWTHNFNLCCWQEAVLIQTLHLPKDTHIHWSKQGTLSFCSTVRASPWNCVSLS